jgi:recombination protein RecA
MSPRTKASSEEVKSEVAGVTSDGSKKSQKLLSTLKKIAEAGNGMFGDGAIFRGGDSSSMDIQAISTGSLTLDNAIGVGGLPRGRIVEISGPEASGKTMVSLSTIAEVQKSGGIAAFIDAEHALTPDWCRSLGVDYDNLLISQPESGEKALSIMKYLVEEAKVDVIVLDSVAALVTQREIDGEMGDAHMAPTARLMSQALKKLTPIVSQSNTVCIFINQIRENVGQMFGNKETTPGGKALKFYSSVRLRASKTYKGEKMAGKGDSKTQIGHNVTVKVLKNKVAPPFRQAQFDLYYNSGIDQDSEVEEMSLTKGVVKNVGGRTYEFESREFKSLKAYKEALASEPELMLAVKTKVKEAIANKVPDVAVENTVVEKDGKLVDPATGEVLDADAGENLE